MTLDERIARQPGSHIVRVPKKQIAALKAERDAYMLKAHPRPPDETASQAQSGREDGKGHRR